MDNAKDRPDADGESSASSSSASRHRHREHRPERRARRSSPSRTAAWARARASSTGDRLLHAVFAGLWFTFGVVGDRIGGRRMLDDRAGPVRDRSARSRPRAHSSSGPISSSLRARRWAWAVLLSCRAHAFDHLQRLQPKGTAQGDRHLGPRRRHRGVVIGPVLGRRAVLPTDVWWGLVFLIKPARHAAGALLVALLAPEPRNPERAWGWTFPGACRSGPSWPWSCWATGSSRAATSASGRTRRCGSDLRRPGGPGRLRRARNPVSAPGPADVCSCSATGRPSSF